MSWNKCSTYICREDYTHCCKLSVDFIFEKNQRNRLEGAKNIYCITP